MWAVKRSDFITRLPHQHLRDFPLELQLIDTLLFCSSFFSAQGTDRDLLDSLLCTLQVNTVFEKEKKIDVCDGGGLST